MTNLPERRRIRLDNYDYSTPGAYFITVCTANREQLFWRKRRGDLWSPADSSCTSKDILDHRLPQRVPLSRIGLIVYNEIQKLNTVYPTVYVDKYCIMPDHIHMIISIDSDEAGRPQVAPTISRVMQQFKGVITKQVGRPIWQKSFYDHGLRNQQDYNETWEYIENNPLKYLLKNAP